MQSTLLGRSDLRVSRICLGTMTFGEAGRRGHGPRDCSTTRWSAASTSSTRPRCTRCRPARDLRRHRKHHRQLVAQTPGMRAAHRAGDQGGRPVRGMRLGAQRQRRPDGGRHRRVVRRQPEAPAHRRHRPVPDPLAERAMCRRSAACTSTRRTTADHAHRRAARGLQRLVQAGKVRHIGLSQRNAMGRGRVRAPGRSSTACRASRRCRTPTACSTASVDNGLDEMMHRCGVSLLAYSPLAFGLLTGKYDDRRLRGPCAARPHGDLRLACASSAGAGPKRWRPRGATTRWHASTA